MTCRSDTLDHSLDGPIRRRDTRSNAEVGPAMLILHVITGLDRGGAETALLRLIKGHRDASYEHRVVSLLSGGGLVPAFREAGISVDEMDLAGSPLRTFVRLFRFIRRLRPDIVQTWLYHADLVGGLAARLGGIRNVVWGIHTTWLTSGGSKSTVVARKTCAWLSRIIPQRIVCVADASRRVHAQIGYASDRLMVIPNGFDVDACRASAETVAVLRADLKLPSDSQVVGWVGRFNDDKDVQGFVRATALLVERFPRLRLVMVGKDIDANNDLLHEWIAQTGFAERFILLGERRDVPACLGLMNVFCLSSRTEAFPLVVGEAMASGLPCVVTDVGDAAMLVADTGVVVSKEDARALADGLASVLDTPLSDRLELGRRAEARIRAHFSMSYILSCYTALYESLSGGKRPAPCADL
jgi:glycosyltransferase involved in cell wall biosynthesis